MKLSLKKNDQIKFINDRVFVAPDDGCYFFKGHILEFNGHSLGVPLGTGPEYEALLKMAILLKMQDKEKRHV